MKQYEQAAERLRTMMLEMKPGDRLPSERQLITILSLSRGTILRAMRYLEDRSLIESIHGRGRFVLGPEGERGTRHDAAYERITHQVSQQLLDQPAGQALPHVNDMAFQFGVSSVTIRRVLRGLAADGLIHTRPDAAGYYAGATS